MALYTQAEYDSLKAAYLELVEGTQVVQVSIGGKFIRYREAQIPAIERLLNVMAKDLGLTVSRVYAKPIGRF
jgi:hypothetical protein